MVFKLSSRLFRSMSVARWPDKQKYKRINDNVHNTINIYHPINRLLDTTPLQRLRNLHQTGIVSWVYPNSEHSRFVHSLGTYEIALKAVCELSECEAPGLVTSADRLAVCAAGLLHDTGHGPFSHMFDGLFAKQFGSTWKHEEMSEKIVDFLLYNERIRGEFAPYFGDGDEYDRNVIFIKELIGSKPFLIDGQWQMKGRGPEKAFLYDIVSNRTSGYDVDKLDYLLRDSQASDVAISINMSSLERIMRHMRVVTDVETGLKRIGFSANIQQTIEDIGKSRKELHTKVYQHWVVRCIECKIVEAMKLASPHLKYRGSNGQMFSLHEVVNDVEAFLKTSDSIIHEINNSDDPNLREAQKHLMDIYERNIMKKLCSFEINPFKFSRNNNANSDDWIEDNMMNLKNEISRLLPDANNSTNYFMILTRITGEGMSDGSFPINKQLFFDHDKLRSNEEILGETKEHSLQLAEPHVSNSQTYEVALFVDRRKSHTERAHLKNCFETVLQNMTLLKKRKLSSTFSPSIKRRNVEIV